MKMVQFQLQFQNLSLEDLKSDEDEDNQPSMSEFNQNQKMEQIESRHIPIAIAFDKGTVPHPHPKLRSNADNAVQMRGAFLLSLPLGGFPRIPRIPTSFDASKLDDIVKRMALEYFIPGNETSLGQLSLYPASNLFLVAPSLKPAHKKMEILLRAAVIHWNMADFFSTALSSSMPLLLKEHFTDFERFLVNIMTGLYRSPDGIPQTDISYLNAILRAWFAIYVELKEQVAGFERYHHDFLNEILNWVRYYKMCALHMGVEWEPTNQPYAMMTKLGGRKVILELIQLLSATYMDDYIREHVLFQMFRESTDLICSLVYDVLNLNRVAEGQKFCRNSLFSEMIKRGLPFEAALEKHLLVINNEILDLQKVALGLEEEFPGVEMVERYVRNTMLHVDGTIRYLLTQERYGKYDTKVMKVLSISHVRI